MAGYSGAPLPRKLGIKDGATVLVDGAPDGFALGELPGGVILHRRAGRGPYDVILLFCRDRRELAGRWRRTHPLTTQSGALWIAWPKRSSGVTTDLDENVIRDHALANGRVDVKVIAVDEVWSGLKHVIRVRDRT